MKQNLMEYYLSQLERSSSEYLSHQEIENVFQTIHKYETGIFSLFYHMEGFWQHLEGWLEIFEQGEDKKKRALINKMSRKTLENKQSKEEEIERVKQVLLNLRTWRQGSKNQLVLLRVFRNISYHKTSYVKFIDYLRRMVAGIEGNRWDRKTGAIEEAVQKYTGESYDNIRQAVQWMDRVYELNFENQYYYQECQVELSRCFAEAKRLQSDEVTFCQKKEALENWCSVDFTLVKASLRQIKLYQNRITRIHNTFSQRYLHYVVFVAKKFWGSNLAFADILQEGNIGLLKAVRKYDYTVGAKFLSYAVYWIKQRIYKAIADQASTIRIPVYVHNEYHSLRKVMAERQKEPGKDPDLKKVASESGKSERKLNTLMGLFKHNMYSLDNESQCHSGATLLSFVPDLTAVDPVIKLEKMYLKDEIYYHLDHLPPRELKIIEMRFGLRNSDRYTLEEVARKFQVSRERVRQLEERALNTLKKKGHERLKPYLYCN